MTTFVFHEKYEMQKKNLDSDNNYLILEELMNGEWRL